MNSQNPNESLHSGKDRKAVYVALVEIRPLEDCEAIDAGEIAGAAVRCYLTSDSRKNAISRVRASLEEQKMKLIEVEWCVANDSVEWKHPDDETAKEFIDLASRSNEVEFGEFHCWPH